MLFYFGSYSIFVAVIATTTALDVIAVFTRLYVRRSLKQKLEMDDWLVIPALVLNIGMAVSVFIGVGDDALTYRYPSLNPTAEESAYGERKMGIVMKIEYAMLLMSATTLTFIKLSFLFFYKRVLVYDKANFKNARNVIIHILMVITIIWGLGFVLIMFTGCRNHFYAHYSTLANTLDKCINTFLYIYALAISDFIMDVLIILTPVPMIWKLHLSPARKVGVTFVFMLGALAVTFSLIRMIWIQWVMDLTDKRMPEEFGNPSDRPFILISTELFWFILEATVALLAVCLPSISSIRRTATINKAVQIIQGQLSVKSDSGSSNNKRPSTTPSLNTV